VKLMAPQFVKPYVKSNKNDARDAKAICEAMSRPGMRYVAVKTVEQQDIQSCVTNSARISWSLALITAAFSLPMRIRIFWPADIASSSGSANW